MIGGTTFVNDVAYWRRELVAAEAAMEVAERGECGTFVPVVALVELARRRVERARGKLATAQDLLVRSPGGARYDNR